MAPADGRAANLVQVEVPLERARRRGRLGGAANLYLSHAGLETNRRTDGRIAGQMGG